MYVLISHTRFKKSDAQSWRAREDRPLRRVIPRMPPTEEPTEGESPEDSASTLSSMKVLRWMPQMRSLKRIQVLFKQ